MSLCDVHGALSSAPLVGKALCKGGSYLGKFNLITGCADKF